MSDTVYKAVWTIRACRTINAIGRRAGHLVPADLDGSIVQCAGRHARRSRQQCRPGCRRVAAATAILHAAVRIVSHRKYPDVVVLVIARDRRRSRRFSLVRQRRHLGVRAVLARAHNDLVLLRVGNAVPLQEHVARAAVVFRLGDHRLRQRIDPQHARRRAVYALAAGGLIRVNLHIVQTRLRLHRDGLGVLISSGFRRLGIRSVQRRALIDLVG